MQPSSPAVLGIHRGAIDQNTVTTHPPADVMKRVKGALNTMGIITEVESEFKLRCIRPKRDSTENINGDEFAGQLEAMVGCDHDML